MSMGRPAAGARARSGLLVVAILVAGLNLRTAVTTVGPLLKELQQGLGMSSGVAGLLTMLPVLCFAVLGSVTPMVARRIGEPGTLTAALALMTVGLAGRALAGTAVVFLLLSAVALAGGAVGNVLLPGLVKRYFPRRTGMMVSAYTTSMALGQALGAALAVPVASQAAVDGWRVGLGVWAVMSGVAVLPWLPLLGRRDQGAIHRWGSPVRLAAHSPTAWALTMFFATQSAQAYIAFGWFAQFFRDVGIPAARAGLLVAFVSVLAIPMSLLVPPLAARMLTQRPLIVVLASCMLVGYVGMLVAPEKGAWLWMLLIGVGLGQFPLALTMIALRSRDAAITTELSTLTQAAGYLIATSGPALVGVLRGTTGGWAWPFVLMFTLLITMSVAGWFAGSPRYVDDELSR